MQGFGVTLPAGHHLLDMTDRELEQGGDQLRLMLGEQADGGRGEVGDDGVDLPAGQLAGAVGGGGDRQLAQAAGVAYQAGGVAGGPPGEPDQPGFHRPGSVERPGLVAVELAHGGGDRGVATVVGRRGR